MDLNQTNIPSLAEHKAFQEKVAKEKVRDNIDTIADPKAREGVMSDVLAVLVVGFSHLTVAIAKAKTLDDIKTAAAPLAVIGEVIDAGIKDGSIKLPYMVKKGGAEAVLQDMVKLSNGVTQVLQSAQKA